MLNIPNILTVFRLIAAPGLAIIFLYFTRPYADWLALILFLFAAITDWFDGYLARLWKQTTKIGVMLDPIADKAMVVIALLIITGFSGMNEYIILPATVIVFREVFVSGLREYLGADAGTLKVTKLAKWKTTAQMVAISVLFSVGIFEHHLGMRSFGMDRALVAEILNGTVEDELNLRFFYEGIFWSWYTGVIMLWLAAGLTLLTGIDYLRKSVQYLRD